MSRSAPGPLCWPLRETVGREESRADLEERLYLLFPLKVRAKFTPLCNSPSGRGTLPHWY